MAISHQPNTWANVDRLHRVPWPSVTNPIPEPMLTAFIGSHQASMSQICGCRWFNSDGQTIGKLLYGVYASCITYTNHQEARQRYQPWQVWSLPDGVDNPMFLKGNFLSYPIESKDWPTLHVYCNNIYHLFQYWPVVPVLTSCLNQWWLHAPVLTSDIPWC